MNYYLLKRRIKENEGFSYKPYKDQLGNLTIGYGHLIKNDEKQLFLTKQNKPHLNNIFEKDFKEARTSFEKNFKKSNLRSRKAKELIIEMVFQIGIKGVLKFEKMIKQIERNNKHLAALEMMNSLWYSQTPKRVENLVNNFLHK